MMSVKLLSIDVIDMNMQYTITRKSHAPHKYIEMHVILNFSINFLYK